MQAVIQDAEAKSNISANLKRILAERQMSQRELARKTNDAVMTINDIVNGKHMAGAAILARIAEAIDETQDSLLFPPKRKSRRSA